MNKPGRIYALLAALGQRINATNGKFLCLITKQPDGYIEVYFDNVPESGPELIKVVDELKDAMKRLQDSIKNFEDKIKYNG